MSQVVDGARWKPAAYFVPGRLRAVRERPTTATTTTNNHDGAAVRRAIATRYDERAYVFHGTVTVAAIRLWLRTG